MIQEDEQIKQQNEAYEYEEGQDQKTELEDYDNDGVFIPDVYNVQDEFGTYIKPSSIMKFDSKLSTDPTSEDDPDDSRQNKFFNQKFMIFGYFENHPIKFCVYFKPTSSNDGVDFIAYYLCPGKNIFGDTGQKYSLDDESYYCLRLSKCRSEWVEKMHYENHELASEDFKRAVNEFQSDKKLEEFSNPVNKYFLNKLKEIILNGIIKKS